MPPISDYMRFGELLPDGRIKRDVKICAITGAVIEPGDAMITIPGTGRFYRVKAPLMWPQNAERFEAARADIEAQFKPSVPTSPDTSWAQPVDVPPNSQEAPPEEGNQ